MGKEMVQRDSPFFCWNFPMREGKRENAKLSPGYYWRKKKKRKK